MSLILLPILLLSSAAHAGPLAAEFASHAAELKAAPYPESAAAVRAFQLDYCRRSVNSVSHSSISGEEVTVADELDATGELVAVTENNLLCRCHLGRTPYANFRSPNDAVRCVRR